MDQQSERQRRERVEEETLALFRALHGILDDDTADRLFPMVWRHLRKIRSGPPKRRRGIVLPPSRDAPGGM
jgi:hypothetical protein